VYSTYVQTMLARYSTLRICYRHSTTFPTWSVQTLTSREALSREALCGHQGASNHSIPQT